MFHTIVQTGEVSLDVFLSLSVPVLVSGGGPTDVGVHSQTTTRDQAAPAPALEVKRVVAAEAAFLHQFLRFVLLRLALPANLCCMYTCVWR